MSGNGGKQEEVELVVKFYSRGEEKERRGQVMSGNKTIPAEKNSATPDALLVVKAEWKVPRSGGRLPFYLSIPCLPRIRIECRL